MLSIFRKIILLVCLIPAIAAYADFRGGGGRGGDLGGRDFNRYGDRRAFERGFERGNEYSNSFGGGYDDNGGYDDYGGYNDFGGYNDNYLSPEQQPDPLEPGSFQELDMF